MLQPGHVLGDRYEIEGTLGHGGMAYVYAAHDRHLDRSVALKVLRPHLTEVDSERFRREIQALARLSHPGIATIFDLGSDEFVYFAMERIDGGAFTDLGPFEDDPPTAVRFLRAAIQVAETLGYVHALGMVHRDLTPRNILLTSRGAPKLMDFGLVQLADTTRELTKTGSTLGTPQYMAPEQATGGATGAATDLYAFGAVLYRTVTGIAAFDAENDQAVMYRHVYDDVQPATQHNPLVPPRLAELLTALLAKRPEDRPRTAYVVAEILRGVLRDVEQACTSKPAAGGSRVHGYATGPVIPRPLHERWRTRLDQGPQWPAGLAAADGFVLAGLRSDALAVLRASDGGRVARFELSDEVDQPPLRTPEHVWVSTRDGALAQLAWPEGGTIWRGEGIEASGMAALHDGLLLATREGHLHRWTTDRTPRWTVYHVRPWVTPPIVHAGHAMALDDEGVLLAIDVNEGRERFRVHLDAAPAPALATRGMLLLLERSGELHGFSLERRDVTWSYGLEGESYGSPATADGRIYAASWAGTLVCIALQSGDLIWSQPLGSAVTASPIVAAGRVWVVTESGDLAGFDAIDGTPIERRNVTNAPIQASVLPLGARLIVAATDGTIAAYE